MTVACYRRAAERDGELKLVLKSKAHDIFTYVQLDKRMDIYHDVEEALASFVHESTLQAS